MRKMLLPAREMRQFHVRLDRYDVVHFSRQISLVCYAYE